MGTFGGHALPGTFFALFGFWHTLQIFNRFYISLGHKTQFKSTVTYPCACLCGKLQKWPVESLIKLFFISVGFSGEIITAIHGGNFTVIGNGQHATMFFFFGIASVVELLVYFRVPLPTDIEYAMYMLAFGIEGVLFRFHLHGRNELDVLLHTLLIYVISISILSICVEMKFRQSVLAALTRTFFVFLQGTWFWQIGFILYNPSPGAQKWKGDDHDEMMIATMLFAWHCAAVLFTMFVICGVVACCHKRVTGYTDNVPMGKLPADDSCRHHLLNIDDEWHYYTYRTFQNKYPFWILLITLEWTPTWPSFSSCKIVLIMVLSYKVPG